MNKLCNVSTSLALLGFLLAGGVQARTPETQAKLEAAFEDVQAMTPGVLRDPSNADVIAELRTVALQANDSLATVLLIRYGDDAVIQACVHRLRSGKRGPMRQLELAGNPRAIMFLAAEFNREEGAEGFFVGDQLKFPVSMTAAGIVRHLIMNSPSFSPAVKHWARGLPPLLPGLRNEIRAWWVINQAALLSENYAAVVTP
jgi:hypothetical protein